MRPSDAQTHLFKLGVGDFYDAPLAQNADTIYRIQIGGNFGAGDWLKDNGDKTTTVVRDKDLGAPAGAKRSNPLADGAGYKILGRRLGNTRSRGILVKADNGVIQNNVIEDCGMSAISAGPECYWNEADYVHHLTISHNTIASSGRFGGNAEAVFIHGDGALGKRDITIRDNQFVSNYDRDIESKWGDDITLSDNSITGAAVWPSALAPQSPVALAQSASLRLSGNIAHHASVYPLVLLCASAVTELSADSPAGIRAASKLQSTP